MDRCTTATHVTLTALADAAASVSSRLRLDPPIRLRTVFPERSRWALGPTTTTAELPELGQLALIVELKRIEVRPSFFRIFLCAEAVCVCVFTPEQ